MVVKYSKKFPYAPYLNEDIGFDISIPDNATEEEMIEAQVRLNRIATAAYHRLNPHMVTAPQPVQGQHQQPIPEINLEKERVEILIDNAENLVELLNYQKDADKYGLTGHWNSKYQNLKNK